MTDKKSFDDQINDIDESLLKLKEEYEKRRNVLRLKKSAVKAKQSKEFRKRRTHYLIQLGSTIDAVIKKHINNTDNEMASWLVTSDTDAKGDESWKKLYQYLLSNPNIIKALYHFKNLSSSDITLRIPEDNELKGKCISASQQNLYFNSWHILKAFFQTLSNDGDYALYQHCIDFLANAENPSPIINTAKNFDGKSFGSILAEARRNGFGG